ncbi:MAG: DUF4340 domain-containing protein [Pseudomonadota bacterium]
MAGAQLERWRRAFVAMAIGLALALMGAGSVWLDQSRGGEQGATGPVFTDWAATVREAAAMELVTPDGILSLERNEDGVWRDARRGGYPVRAERIAQLDSALGGLRFERAMTRDAEKFDRLGLGETASRATLRDSQGGVLADLFVGTSNAGRLYIRPADTGRAFAARGEAPPLTGPSDWLGLDFLQLDASSILRAEIMPETGAPYRLEKTIAGARHFTLSEPDGWNLVTAGAGNGVATATAALRFRDVRPADEVTGIVLARHAATTVSGLGVIMTIRDHEGASWAVMEFRGLTEDAEPRAARFNAITSGWAYQLSEDAYERLTRPLNQIADVEANP